MKKRAGVSVIYKNFKIKFEIEVLSASVYRGCDRKWLQCLSVYSFSFTKRHK